MKILLSLIQTKLAVAILVVLMIITGFIGYQVKERGAEMAAQKQELNRRLEFARAALEQSQKLLQSSRHSLQKLTQHKDEVIREKGELWYEDYRHEIESNIAESQNLIQEDRQNIKQLSQKLFELELQPLFAF